MIKRPIQDSFAATIKTYVMKVILIANLSANGRVLLSDDPQHQLPQEAMDFYLNHARQAGNLVIGANTFENFSMFPPETKELFNNITIVVISATPVAAAGYTVVESPEAAIGYLAGKGFTEIAVGGGTGTFNSFIDKELVTDVYFNISPVITGNGGVLGSNVALHTKFQLAAHAVINDFVQLHWVKQGSSGKR